MDKALVKKLPKDRPFTELEAMFSLQVNYDCNNPVTLSGLAKRFKWSRKRAQNLFKRVGLTIERTGIANQSPGYLRLATKEQQESNQRTTKGQLRFVDSKWLSGKGGNKRTTKKQERSNKGNTISNPDPNPNPNSTTKNNCTRFKSKEFKPDWFPEDDWNDAMLHRQKKKGVHTERAIKSFVAEIKKAVDSGFTVAQCIDEMTNRGWAGFKAEWMNNKSQKDKGKNHGFQEARKSGSTDWLS